MAIGEIAKMLNCNFNIKQEKNILYLMMKTKCRLMMVHVHNEIWHCLTQTNKVLPDRDVVWMAACVSIYCSASMVPSLRWKSVIPSALMHLHTIAHELWTDDTVSGSCFYMVSSFHDLCSRAIVFCRHCECSHFCHRIVFVFHSLPPEGQTSSWSTVGFHACPSHIEISPETGNVLAAFCSTISTKYLNL